MRLTPIQRCLVAKSICCIRFLVICACLFFSFSSSFEFSDFLFLASRFQRRKTTQFCTRFKSKRTKQSLLPVSHEFRYYCYYFCNRSSIAALREHYAHVVSKYPVLVAYSLKRVALTRSPRSRFTCWPSARKSTTRIWLTNWCIARAKRWRCKRASKQGQASKQALIVVAAPNSNFIAPRCAPTPRRLADAPCDRGAALSNDSSTAHSTRCVWR